MTNYTSNTTLPMTEIRTLEDRAVYFKQAQEALQNHSSEVTFLPIAKDADADLLVFDLEMETYHSSQNNVKENRLIVENTISETFKRGDLRQISKLINTCGNYYYNSSENRKNNETYQHIICNVVRKYAESTPGWLEQLGLDAKLTIARLFDNQTSLGASLSQNQDFLKIEMSGNHNNDDKSSLYATENAAKNLLDAVFKPQFNKLPAYSWNIKAMALSVYLSIPAGNKQKIVQKTFLNLLESADSSGKSRNEEVKTLTKLAGQIADSFDFQHNRHYYKELLDSFPAWAEKVPACDEAENFFYTCLKKMNIEQDSISDKNLNSFAFGKAYSRCQAERIMDNIEKNKTASLQTFDLETALKHCPERVLKYKGWDSEALQNIVFNQVAKLPDRKYFDLMTRILDQDKENPLIQNKLLDFASKLTLASPEAGKFIRKLTPQIKIGEIHLAALRQFEAEKAQIMKQLQKEKEQYSQLENAQAILVELKSAYHNMPKADSNDKNFISLQKLEQMVANVFSGKETTHLTFEPSSGVKKLFMSEQNKTKEKQQEFRIIRLNQILDKLPRQQGFEVLKEYTGQLFAEKTEKDLRRRLSEQNQQCEIYSHKEMEWESNHSSQNISKQIKFYEEAQLKVKLDKLAKDHESQFGELKLKARERIAFGLNGHDVGEESGLARQEMKTKETFAKKTQELKGRIKNAVHENLKDRGVFEKPDGDEPNKTGQKIMPQNSQKVLKMMRDKRLYEELSKQK